MVFKHQMSFGSHRELDISVCMSWEPAEPNVGLPESFSLDSLEVERFIIITPHQDGAEHDRLNHVGDENNWLLLDEMIERILNNDRVEWHRLIEAFWEAAADTC